MLGWQRKKNPECLSTKCPFLGGGGGGWFVVKDVGYNGAKGTFDIIFI